MKECILIQNPYKNIYRKNKNYPITNRKSMLWPWMTKRYNCSQNPQSSLGSRALAYVFSSSSLGWYIIIPTSWLLSRIMPGSYLIILTSSSTNFILGFLSYDLKVWSYVCYTIVTGPDLMIFTFSFHSFVLRYSFSKSKGMIL